MRSCCPIVNVIVSERIINNFKSEYLNLFAILLKVSESCADNLHNGNADAPEHRSVGVSQNEAKHFFLRSC